MHRVARTYGILPHQVLELTPYELAIASVCLETAAQKTQETCKRADMVFPVLGLEW